MPKIRAKKIRELSTKDFVRQTKTTVRKLERFLYQLETPQTIPEYALTESQHQVRTFEYVVVSAIDYSMEVGHGHPALNFCETFIFPADSEGEILNWGELEGSIQGCADADLVARNTYDVIDEPLNLNVYDDIL